MKISEHISLKEALRSNTAKRLGINNTPDEEAMANMKVIAQTVFEPLREHFGEPIYISSFYRSPQLNKAIGGSSRSQHCEGRAIDLDDTFTHATNAEMFNYIKEHLNFDQLIWEFGTSENPDWVHVSYVSEDQNRKRCLKAEKANGKTQYRVI